jgi:hypothetical protein
MLNNLYKFEETFCNVDYLRRAVDGPSPNPQDEGPPIVDCLLLLIQRIPRHCPYLEAVSSIRNLRKGHPTET